MAELRRVEPTDLLRIPAGDWNAAMQQVEAAHGQRHETGRQSIDRGKDGDKCLIRNDTGMDLDRFSVVGLGAPIILPSTNLQEFKRQVTFRGVVPTESHLGRFAVLLAPCATGAITEAAVAGVTWVQLLVDDPLDWCADVLSGSTDYLETSPNGSAQVLWRESDTGVCWAAIRFGTICGEDWSDESSWSDDSSFSDDSSSEVCQGITETVDVLIPEPSRKGDSICFPKLRLRFCEGLYVGSESLGKTCVYVCCDDSSSSWDDFSELSDESSEPIVQPSDVSDSPEDSSISIDDSSRFEDSSSFDESLSSVEDSSIIDDSSLVDDSWSDSPIFDDPALEQSDSWSDDSFSDDSSSSSV